MKPLLPLATTVALMFSSNILAQSEMTIEQSIHHSSNNVIQLEIKRYANEIGLSVEAYMNAANRFERLNEKIDSNDEILEFIGSSPEFKAALPYLESGQKVPAGIEEKLINRNNLIQAKMATRLGLDIGDYGRFIQVYGNKRHETLTMLNSKTNTQNPNFDIKKIRVVCDDCDDSVDISTRLYITESAREAGIGQYHKFHLSFEANTGEVQKVEIWQYNDYSGAWKSF